jgi:hypothetical protein
MHGGRHDVERHLRHDPIEQADHGRPVAQPRRRTTMAVDQPLDATVHRLDSRWPGRPTQGPFIIR